MLIINSKIKKYWIKNKISSRLEDEFAKRISWEEVRTILKEYYRINEHVLSFHYSKEHKWHMKLYVYSLTVISGLVYTYLWNLKMKGNFINFKDDKLNLWNWLYIDIRC